MQPLIFLLYRKQFNLEIQFLTSHLVVCIEGNGFLILVYNLDWELLSIWGSQIYLIANL